MGTLSASHVLVTSVDSFAHTYSTNAQFLISLLNFRTLMPLCLRKGCGQEYDESDNTETSCRYHSGGPVRITHDLCSIFHRSSTALQVFHEGLKSWSCCSDTNRPVLDFDSFMAIAVRRPFCATNALGRLK